MVCAVAVSRPALLLRMTLAVPLATETVTTVPLLVVTTLLPLTRATSLPSMTSFSAAPLATLVTVNVIWATFCPDSTVLIVAPLNSCTAEVFSV